MERQPRTARRLPRPKITMTAGGRLLVRLDERVTVHKPDGSKDPVQPVPAGVVE